MPLSTTAKQRRAYWLNEIVRISGQFGQDSQRLVDELAVEVKRDGYQALVDHLQLCGAIPEGYRHDSSEEKLYSKYTDALLASVFREIGFTSAVLSERADAADVEAVCPDFGLVADAKVFRLSRTAKNQKDFKVDAMHGWKAGKAHAMVVCPIYQLPPSKSQVYQQAIARNVCIFSYSHLAVLLQFTKAKGEAPAQKLLLTILKSTENMNPTKDAGFYWLVVNRAMLDASADIAPIWASEKLITLEAIEHAKAEALAALASQREAVMKMTRDQAIASLLKQQNFEGKLKKIDAVKDNGLMSIG